jgi:hypothetical protein
VVEELLHNGQEIERVRKEGARDKISSRSHPSDLLLPCRSHLLKSPEPLQIALPSEDQEFDI